MSNKKSITADMYVFNGMKTIVESYEEIAAMRMRKVKKSVLQNREFLTGLSDIYQRVIITYKIYASKKHSRSTKKDWMPLETNGKTVTILLASNTGLYGDIIKRTFQLFVDNVVNSSSDVVIVGRIGRQLFEALHSKKEFKYFDMLDNGVDRKNLTEILSYILQYSNVIVYHGFYISVLSQQVTSTFVTGKILDSQKDTDVEELKCLIEPSVEEVTEFFEKQILSAIFEQSVYEASLSKFASRMVNLDVANGNISALIKKSKFIKLKIKHMDDNLSQLERLSGISMWA